jgi:hypothetical protein
VVAIEVADADVKRVVFIRRPGREVAFAASEKNLSLRVIADHNIAEAVAVEVGGSQDAATENGSAIGWARSEGTVPVVEKGLEIGIARIVGRKGDDVGLIVFVQIDDYRGGPSIVGPPD